MKVLVPTETPPCSQPAAYDAKAPSSQAAGEHQDLLIAELNHRLKNVLALVRTLVRRSGAQAGTLDEFNRSLDQRIQALALAHDLLIRNDWSPAPLRDLLAAELEPYMAAGERVAFRGPPVLLDPRAHSALALVIHELATNAAKYGALKADRGRVAVTWEYRKDHLHLLWEESGGPPVCRPKRLGFGATVIERTIPHELGGTSSARFAASGVQVEIEIPGNLVMSGDDKSAEKTPKPKAHDLPKGLRLLVVEDNMILALDVEDMLTRHGVAQVEVVSSSEEALRRLEAAHFDLALLDLKLTKGNSLPVATRLTELAIPFAFATGYGERAILPPPFAEKLVIGKPYSESYLLGRLVELLKSAG